ncbi:MAG: 2-phospho-L-lactate transferase [Byssovorax sp.]
MKARVLGLSGGVGGARFLHGLYKALPAGALTIAVNTGDDFEHWGLWISPDLDTVMYTLSDLGHEERGWGLAEESFATLSMIRRYGGDDWFALGDRDLATHLLRTEALRRGEPLHAVTDRLCRALGITAQVLPMADGPCRTMIDTEEEGTLPFQVWFVRHRAAPKVTRVWSDGAPPPAPGLVAAIEAAELVLIGPSNPYVSIDPILDRPGVRAALRGKTVVAVSPLVHGQAVKGPLAAMIPALGGREASSAAIAAHYGDLLSGMVVETGDDEGLGALPSLATSTVMKTRADSLRLAREVLAFAEALRR